MITPSDESFHPHRDHPYWNESGWFPVMVPEQALSGWVYFFHRPNMNLSVGGLALWDPSGEETYDCLYYDWGDLFATPDSADMFDFALPNGLAVKCIEPLRAYQLSYEGDGCRMNLEWTAVMEPHDSGFPKGSEEWGSSHYEQCGRMTGSMVMDGRQIDVDCWSNRDRSWGPRLFKTNPRADFPWGIASDRHGFHCYAMSDHSRDADPIVGTTERVLFGWYRRDGVTSTLVEGTRRVERGDDGRPLSIIVDAADDSGRHFRAEGRCVNWLKWHGYPFMYQWWSLTRWDIDGDEAWGEVQDYFPVQQHRRFKRGLAKER